MGFGRGWTISYRGRTEPASSRALGIVKTRLIEKKCTALKKMRETRSLMREDLGSFKKTLSEFMERQDRYEYKEKQAALLQYLPQDNPTIAQRVQNRKCDCYTSGLALSSCLDQLARSRGSSSSPPEHGSNSLAGTPPVIDVVHSSDL